MFFIPWFQATSKVTSKGEVTFSYIDQMAGCLKQRYKEHIQYITSNNPHSASHSTFSKINMNMDLDFKLSPWFEYCICSSGYFPGGKWIRKTAWFLVPPGSLFYTYSKRNGTNTLHTITYRNLTRVLYTSPLHTHPPTLNRPLPDAEHPPLVRLAPVLNPDTGINFFAFPHTSQCISSLFKMELIQGSETSANYNLTPGKYRKEHIWIKLNLHSIQRVGHNC